jgi:hypothetical protein
MFQEQCTWNDGAHAHVMLIWCTNARQTPGVLQMGLGDVLGHRSMVHPTDLVNQCLGCTLDGGWGPIDFVQVGLVHFGHRPTWIRVLCQQSWGSALIYGILECGYEVWCSLEFPSSSYGLIFACVGLGHLVRAFPNPMCSNVVNKASPGLLGECGGPWQSLVTIGYKSMSLDSRWGRLTSLVSKNPAWPALRSFGRHNFVIRTPNWVNQNLILCILMSSLTWCSQNQHLKKRFYMYIATLFLHSQVITTCGIGY